MPYSRAISLWEQAILGKTTAIIPRSNWITDTEKKSMAREITRYVLIDMLGYRTIDEAIKYITPVEVKRLLLDKVYHGLYVWPEDCGKNDWDYKISYVMGVRYDPAQQVKRYYKQVIDGERNRFPDHFFEGPYGDEKLSILLAEAIRKFIPLPVDFQDKTYDDKLAYYYVYFSSPYLVIDKLKEAKIYEICNSFYDSPLEWFHNALHPEDRVQWMYDNGKMLWDTAEERHSGIPWNE